MAQELNDNNCTMCYSFISLLVIAVIAFYFFLKKHYSYWKSLGVYQETPNWIFGNIKDVFFLKKNEAQLFESYYNNLGNLKYGGFYYFWKPAIFLKDAELIKKIMTSDFNHFYNHPAISDFRTTDKIIHSLFTMSDTLWKERRTFFSITFTPKKVKQMFPSISENSNKIVSLLKEKMKQNNEIEVENLMACYTSYIILITLYGIETDSLENSNSKFLQVGECITKPSLPTVFKILLFLFCPQLYKLFRLQSFPPEIHQSFLEFVKHIIEKRKQEGTERDDIIGVMLKVINSEEGASKIKMDMDEVAGHIYTFFEAGFDSTSLILSYSLYELGKNPEIQQQIFEEIERSLKDGEITYESTNELTYLDQFINEVLRKYPPSGMIKRVCTKTYRLDDKVVIPEGMMVFIPAHSLHHDSNHFAEPDKFNPERFEKGTAVSPAYIPFGAGPRICIGMKVAELSIKVALLRILMEFEILPSTLKEEPQYDPKTIFITVRPLNGIYVRMKPRNP